MKKPPFVVKERFFSRLAVHYFVFLYVSLCTLLQGVFPAVLGADGEAIKEFLIALSRLPGAGEAAEKTLNAGDEG